jgi:imidazolonepropionase-like amidohydrolase
MGLGTDAGSPGVKIGLSLRNEIVWWLEAGFSGEEILAAATAGNAKLMGKENDVGRLTPGRLAFLAGFPKGVSIDKILTQVPLIVGRPRL